MKLHGNMVIELTDEITGEVEVVEEDNMVTNAVNNIFGLNPMGVFYMSAGTYDTPIVMNDNLLPICPHTIGGILLFSQAIDENVDNIYLSSAVLPVAYASNDVNATANTKRGSLNLTESKALDNGYKFVWEFTPSQGNGTIAAVGLTSALGGANAYGSEADSTTGYLEIKRCKLDGLSLEEELPLFKSVEMDFEKGFLWSLAFDSASVVVYKHRLPVFDIGLNEKLDDSTLTLLEEKAIPCSTFKFQGSYTPYGNFMDGFNGYWYGFSNNSGNSSGDATVLWVKIKKSDYSKEEGSWTLSNAHLLSVGSMKADSSYPQRVICSVVRNGYLYVPAYDKTGIYKINTANSTDVTLIDFGFTSELKPMGGSGSCENYLVLIGDLIIGYDFMVTIKDEVMPIYGCAKFYELATPLYQYKQFLTGFSASYGNEYHITWLLMPYLATINNLSSAVVKTTDKTMKITYTLKEADA